MAPIKMRNLTTFPIERLCFDLKLEVLEQLDARDVIELGKVNQGFQWMISSRPSVVFGHHVHVIEFGLDRDEIEALNMKKLNSESLEISLDVIRHFSFIKNIRSCNQLGVCRDYDSPIDRYYATFLKQLEAVKSLDFVYCSAWNLDLLSHLSIKIERYAGLPVLLQEAPSIKDIVGHFIEAQLNECKMVEFYCKHDDEIQFCYNASLKTHIKYVGIFCYDGFVPSIQRMVSQGIPSQHPAAVMRVSCEQNEPSLVAFFKEYPGMKQINGKNRQAFITLANDRGRGSGYPDFMMKDLCFRRNINATRDCIYMLSLDEFLAFYIKPDEMLDH